MDRRQEVDNHHQNGDGSVPDRVISPLFGRAAVLADIVRNPAPLCVVTGDAGIGKTTLLECVSRQPALGYASSPHQILQSEPFEHALVVVLADALRRLAGDRSRAQELSASLSAVLRALSETAVSDIPDIVVSALLTSLLPGLGAPVASAFKALRRRVKPGGANALAARAAETVSPLVVHTLTGIVAEATRLASPAPISLVLDSGERSTATDRRLLADVADALPPGSRVILGYRTGDLASDDALKDLIRRSEPASVVELGPLDETGVREWLAAEGILGVDAAQLLALTEGNPLLLGDVMVRLRRGEAATEVPPGNALARLTESSWHDLSTEGQRATRQLVVLDQPLPREDVLDLLGVDVSQWAQLLDELRRARIVVDRADGSIDVHQLRRRVILDQLLEPFELPHLFAQAAGTVERLIKRTGDVAWLAQYSTLVERAEPLRAADPVLDAICAASDDELRVIASVMELQSTYDASFEGVMYYAATIWHLEGDVADVLARLVALELVREHSTFGDIVYIDAADGSTESHRPLSTYGPVSLSPQQRLLFLGRSVRRLGRIPIDAVAGATASWVQNVETEAYNLRPGRALNLELLQAWAEFWPGPALVIKGRYRTIPLCAVFWFKTAAERDLAARNVVPRELFHGRLEVDLRVELPQRRLPALRWLRAVFTPARTPELVSRIAHGGRSRWLLTAQNAASVVAEERSPEGAVEHEVSIMVDPELWLDQAFFKALAHVPGAPRTAAEGLRLRAALDDAVWRCSDEEERFALELRSEVTWHYANGPDGYVALAVAGTGPGVVRHASLPAGDDAAARIAIREQLNLDYLSTELFLTTATEPPGTADAVIEWVGEYRSRARRANQGQRRRTVSLEPELLTATIIDGVRGWYDDARYLERELASIWTPPVGPSPPPRVLVAIALEERGTSPPGWHSTALCALSDARSGEPEVEVRFIDDPAEVEINPEYLHELATLEYSLAASLDSDPEVLQARSHPLRVIPDGRFEELFPHDGPMIDDSGLAAGLLPPVIAMLVGHDWWDLALSW